MGVCKANLEFYDCVIAGCRKGWGKSQILKHKPLRGKVKETNLKRMA